MSPFQDDGKYPPGVSVDQLGYEPSCKTCVHRRKGTTGCDAFPDRIPVEILRGQHDHKTPYPGDNGIQYEPRDA